MVTASTVPASTLLKSWREEEEEALLLAADAAGFTWTFWRGVAAVPPIVVV